MDQIDLTPPLHPELISIANDIRARPQQGKFFSPLVQRLADYILEFEKCSKGQLPHRPEDAKNRIERWV